MFRTNEQHRQPRMFTVYDQLSKTGKRLLEHSWAKVFYEHYFCRLDEQVFEVLYSEKKSRPNVPVNILVGFEALKSGFGLTDEQLYRHFLFDLEYRYALGLQDIDEGAFELRTLYNFRSAVTAYEEKHGVNLIRKVCEQITDAQLDYFQVRTGVQRMDSTLVGSNIRKMSRLQLLVEIIHRLYRILSEADRNEFGVLFDAYVAEDAQHYCYRIAYTEVEGRLQQVGKDLQDMLVQLKEGYGHQQAYGDALRVFGEHFRREGESQITLKAGTELSGSTLQSPDDREATYRNKKRESSRGYVANITETCGEENDLQLITAVSVAPNCTDDQQLLSEDLANLSERVDVEVLYTDGGYTGDTASRAVEAAGVEHQVSAIKGRKPSAEIVGLDSFTLERDDQGVLTGVVCPEGQRAEIRPGRKAGRFNAGFCASRCEGCPLIGQCPAKPLKRRDVRILRISLKDVQVALRRQQVAQTGKEVINRRASVEATVRSVIHPFGGHLCKLPVRGKSRITTMIVQSAVMVNIRRITGYLCPKGPAPLISKPIVQC